METHGSPKSKFSPLKPLLKESKEIFQVFSEIQSELCTGRSVSLLSSALKSYSDLHNSFTSLVKSLTTKAHQFRVKSSELSKNCKKIRRSSSKMLSKQKAKILNKEKAANKTQESINESLGKIKQLWAGNLKTMKTGIRKRAVLKDHIQLQVKKFDEEMTSEFAGKTLDKELISHQSAFEVHESCHDLSVISGKSVHRSNSSIEFEQCMAELDMFRQQPTNGNISIEKSFGGWKSEFDSETESFSNNPNEIKHAINILKKANLLNTKGGNLIDKLTGLMRSPGNTQKIELLLQLHDLQNHPRQRITRNLNKPPLLFQGVKKSGELAATPKAAFVLSEEAEFGRTILSSENPLSARNGDEGFDNILLELRGQREEGLEGHEGLEGLEGHEGQEENSEINHMAENELNDVQLEDLLNIPFIFPELKTASGVIENPVEEREEIEERQDYLSSLGVLSPSEVKIPSPAKKQLSGFDYQSTGISSQSGLRSRITLKTGGSEASQKVFTPGSKGEESFKYM